MKNVLLSAAISATLGLTALPSMAKDVDLRMSWWGGNGRHQVTLKALEEFHKQNPDINVKAEYTGWDGHLSRLTTQIAGGTDPVEKATPGTIRGDFALETQNNLVHGSDSPESAAREIALWFPDLAG